MAKYGKIGQNYYTVGEKNNLQQISESDILGRMGDMPGGASLDKARQAGLLQDFDPSNLSTKQIADEYNPGQSVYEVAGLELGGSKAYLRNQGQAQALGINVGGLPTGQLPVDQDFAQYLNETKQTYNPQAGFSGGSGIPSTAQYNQGVQAGTVNPQTGQPIQQIPQTQQTPRTFEEQQAILNAGVPKGTPGYNQVNNVPGQTGQTTPPQATNGFGRYVKQGKDVIDSETGKVIDQATFQKLGLNYDHLNSANPSQEMLNQGIVTTSTLPQEQNQSLQAIQGQITQTDDLVSRIMSSYVPSDRESDLQRQIDQFTNSYEAGQNKIEDQTIPMELIVGQQASLERQANQKLAGLQRELTRLGNNREGQLKALTAAYDIRRQSAQDALAFWKATAPDQLAMDENTGTAYFRNPVTGEVTATQLPGWKPKDKGYPAGIVGEYEFYADQEKQAGRKPLSFNEYQTLDANRKARANAGAAGGLTTSQLLSQVGRISDDVRSDPDVKDFVQIRDGYERVQTGAGLNNAQGDLALLFGYMKMLDPNSVVRETEFANAEAAMGYAQRVLNIPDKLIKGERLTPQARTQFTSASGALYKAKEGNYNNAINFYKNQSSTLGVDPNLVLRNFGSQSGSKEIAEADINETIQANNSMNREELINQLVGKFPEFDLDEVASYVYKLIPDKK